MNDDLTRIKDIGPARERWLNDHGIRTYADLAAANADWLSEQFKNDGRPVPLALIDAWIKAAAEKVQFSSAPMEPQAVTNVIPFQRHPGNSRTEDGWEEFASFYVSFQHKQELDEDLTRTRISYRTYADHIEANETQEWPGIEGDGLCQWVLNHVHDIVGDFATSAGTGGSVEEALGRPREAEPRETRPTALAVQRVEVTDDAGNRTVGYPEQRFDDWVLSDRPLTVEFDVWLRTPEREGYALQGWPVQVTLAVHDLATSRRVTDNMSIELWFSASGSRRGRVNVTPPSLSPGLYRVRLVARVEGDPAVLTLADIPLLQVI